MDDSESSRNYKCVCICNDGKHVEVDAKNLAQFSRYFSALVQSGMKETTTNEITFKFLSSDVITFISRYLAIDKSRMDEISSQSTNYSENPKRILSDEPSLQIQRTNCDKNLDKCFLDELLSQFVESCEDHLEDLLFAADYLDVPKIKMACSEYLCLTVGLNSKSFTKYLYLGMTYSLKKLQEILLKYMIIHGTHLCLDEEVLDHLPRHFLQEMLRSDKTRVKSEWDLVMIVEKWLKHCLMSEPKDVHFSVVSSLLQNVRVPRLLVDADQNIYFGRLENEHVKEYVENAIAKYKSDPDKFCKSSPLQWQIRRPVNIVITLRIPLGKSLMSSVMLSSDIDSLQAAEKSSEISQADNTKSKHHQTLTFQEQNDICLSLPMESLREFSTCVLNRSMYIAGGQCRYSMSGQFAVQHVFRLDLDQLQWHKVSSMLTPRCLFYLGSAGGRLYAVGGINSTGELASVECYDPHVDKWTALASLDYSIHEHAGCVHSEKLYISGGHDGRVQTRLVSFYCSLAERWFPMTPMTVPRSYHAMAALRERVFVIGGCRLQRNKIIDIKSCEYYSFSTRQWSFLRGFPSNLTSCLCAFPYKDSLVVLGGYSFGKRKFHTQITILDMKSLIWDKIPVAFSNKLFQVHQREIVFQPVTLGENIYQLCTG